MPLYAYYCAKCSYDFDETVDIKNRKKVKCPRCGLLAAKLIKTSGIKFSGSGFHTNDYGPYGPEPRKR